MADLVVPTAAWPSTSDLRVLASLHSSPSYGERVLVVELNGASSTLPCPPPSEPGMAWSAGMDLNDAGAFLELAVYFPGGNLDEFGGILVTDDPDFVPGPAIRSEDNLNALFTDISGRTTLHPKEVETGEVTVLNCAYTVGRLGLPAGQRIEFLVPNNGWSEPQIREGTGEGFLTIHNTGRARAEIDQVVAPGSAAFPDYWRIQVVVGKLDMQPSDVVTITYGDRSRNGHGTVVPVVPQTMDGRTPRLRAKLLPPLTVATDRFGTGRLTLSAASHRHSVTVVPGETAKFLVVAPSHALVGQPHTVNVVAVDRFNNLSHPPFRGSVRVEFDGVVGSQVLRESFSGTDRGIKSVTWTPPSAGAVRLIVDDTTGRKGISNPILCLDEHPADTVYWGDLQCHSHYSGGLNRPSETLAFARDVAFLDFCCVADEANLMSERQWAQAQQDANRANVDGKFVALVGYQWGDGPTSANRLRVGSRTVVTSGRSAPLIKGGRAGESLTGAFETLRDLADEVVVFANHPVVDASWEQHAGDLETAVEVYSSSGSSERRGDAFAANELGQGISVDEILATGARVAFVGCSGGYEGTPGVSPEEAMIRSMHGWRPYRAGLTAVLADDLTRTAIVDAIRRGRVYATTGHRSILEFHMNDASMGDVVELGPGERRLFAIRIVSEHSLRRVEIIRNGESVVAQSAASTMHALNWEDRRPSQGIDSYYLRVSNWDGGLAWTSPIWIAPKGGTVLAQRTEPAGALRTVGAALRVGPAGGR